MVETALSDDRRRRPRKRTLKGAKAVFGDFRYTYPCVVRNLTHDGALVRTDYVVEIPDEFFLWDPGDMSLQKVEVIWRTDRDLGIRFQGDPVSVHASGDPKLARFKFM